MPLVLKTMMRHGNTKTTEQFYVGENADRFADALWKVQDAEVGDMLDSILFADSPRLAEFHK